MTKTVTKAGFGKALLAAGTAAVLSFGFAGSAKADLDIFGTIQIDNLFIFGENVDTGADVDLNFVGGAPNNFNSTNTAVLNGSGTTNSAAFPNPVDALQACVDGGTGACAAIGENDYTQNNGLNYFSRADSDASQGNLFLGDAQVDAVNEIRLNVGGTNAGTDSAAIDLDGDIQVFESVEVTLPTDTLLLIQFDVTSLLEGDLLAGMGGGGSVEIEAVFTVSVDGQEVARWEPNTVANNVTPLFEPCNLNANISVTTLSPTASHQCDGFFRAVTGNLSPNGPVQAFISLDLSVISSGRLDEVQVPEPSALLLMGVGLLGLGAVARRRKAAA